MSDIESSDIFKFFHPKSVAVVGASSTEGKIGYAIMNNLLNTGDYKGTIYPVNPRYQEVMGVKAYPSISELPEPPEMAILVVPGKYIPDVVEECGRSGCQNVVIITAGFSETGSEGKALERETLANAHRYGVRMIGPNCLGVFCTEEGLNASFAHTAPKAGPIGFISQSGAICTSVIEYAVQENIGFSDFVSIGNKADVDDADLIRYFGQDDRTRCVCIYMESVPDGRKFYEAAKEASETTPVVVLKVGRTEEGAKAASSHTGALAGADSAYTAAFNQSGVYRADSMSDLFDASRALAYQPLPKGENLVIYSNAGGPGVISSDAASRLGLKLAELSEETIGKLSEICPPTWSHGNPVDIIGDADVERYDKGLHIVLDAPEVDAVVCLLAPVSIADPLEVAKGIVEAAKTTDKPIIASFVGIIAEESENYLERHGIPAIEFPERAITAMHALMMRRRYLQGGDA